MNIELRTIIVLGAVAACQRATTSASEQALAHCIDDTGGSDCGGSNDCDPGTGPAPGKTLPGTTPIHQTFPVQGGGTINFDCYGACGASCSLVNKFTGTKLKCVE